MPKKNKDWPPQQLIDDLLKRCQAAEDKGTTRFAGMSYEQGILYGIRWMLGKDEYDPLEGGGNERPVPIVLTEPH